MGNSEEQALRLLQAIYDEPEARSAPVFVSQLAPGIGLSEQEANAAWRYLSDKGLIKTYNLQYTATINAHGIDAIEKARQQPNRPSAGFPSVTYNTVNIHNAVAATVQQAGAGATVTQTKQSSPGLLARFTAAIGTVIRQLFGG